MPLMESFSRGCQSILPTPELISLTLAMLATIGSPGAPALAGNKPGKFDAGWQAMFSPAICALSGVKLAPTAWQAPIRPHLGSVAPAPLVTGTTLVAGLPTE